MDRSSYLILLVYFISLWSSFGVAQYVPSICPDNSYVGDVLGDWTTDTLNIGGRIYVGEQTTEWAQQFTYVDCYGSVKYFEFKCRTRTPASGPVGFAVWRPDGAGNYDLLGEYTLTFECTDETATMKTADTHPWERIPVRPGDRLAFMSKDSNSRVQVLKYGANQCVSCQWALFTGNQAATTFHTSSGSYSVRDDLRINFRAVLGPGIAPSINNLPTTIYVRETESAPREIFTVEKSDENTQRLTDFSGGDIRLIRGDDVVFGPFNEAGFSMDLTTGVITMTAQFDYETQDVYYIPVVVHDGGSSAAPDGLSYTATLTVSVVDVNETHVSLNIPATETIVTEDYPIGTSIYTVDVTADNDGALIGPYTYAIDTQTETGLFVIDPVTGEVSPAKDLKTATSTKTHQVNVYATDANTFQIGPMTLTIILADDNTPPVLDNPSFAVSISEDTIVGYDIFSFEAIDNDADTVTYRLIDTDPPIGETIFTLDNKTGIISLVDNAGLDFETETTYLINVEYTDGVHVQTQTVTVTITDVNEPPYFVTKYYEDTYNDQIDPRAPNPDVPHIFGFTFDAVDPDGDDVEYIIEGGYGSSEFYVNVDKLETLESIIMQDLWSYHFLITMRVRDVNGLYGDTALVNITWSNLDDDHGLADATPAVTINAQDTFAGDEIYNLASKVTGAEFFDHFTYTLDSIDPDNGYLELHPVTGVVSASRSFHDWYYDGVDDDYTLVMTATDRDGHTASTTLTVTVANYKVPPIWDNLDETIDLDETIGDRVQVYQVEASDADDDVILSYNMTSHSPMEALDKFTFDPSTGILKTKPDHTLSEDYEAGSTQYVFTFTARDFLHTSDVGTLTIDINDINEHPRFTDHVYNAVTFEAAAANTRLTMSPGWEVKDPDGDGVSYTELTGPYSEYFYVSSTNGAILTTSVPTDCDEEQSTSMYLEVRVSDGSLTDKAIVNIEVQCVNDRGVFFSQDAYFATVAENTYGGAFLLQTTATDKDYPAEHSTITYTIDGFYVDDQTVLGDLFFEIDPETGEITVAHQVNFESYKSIQFTVRASDGKYFDTATVNVTITDANDIRPMFIEDFQDTELPSYTQIGTVVAQVAAYDNDTGSYGSLRYFFLMEENYEYFTIDEVTGVVNIHQPLQDDITYILYTYAQDQDTETPQISASSIIRVDSYSAWKFHIDIHVSLSVEEITARQQDFIYAINATIAPWFCRIAEIRPGTQEPMGVALTRNLLAEDGESIVTIYGLEDDLARYQTYVDVHKSFVYRDQMLKKLRRNLYSDPVDALVGTNMTEWGITKVEPTYPNWWIDTVPGVVTIGVICFLLCAGILGAVLGTCYYFKLACFQYCDRQADPPVLNNKPPPPPPSQAQIFDFNYHQYEDDKTPVPMNRTPTPLDLAKPKTPSQIQLEEKPLNTGYNRNIAPVQPDRYSPRRLDSASTVHTQIIPKRSNYDNNMSMGYRLDQ